ncbi:RDD family protein [Algihabitans albus]|uniref:RDD family protein n=1 Tax=Algihabitans albus TaxID=2164067 RepID=UPI000E5C7EA5|nr:RDD family protein [Algihabitans albus]
MTSNLPARRPFLMRLGEDGNRAFEDTALFDEVLTRRTAAFVVDAIILAVLAVVLWFSLGLIGILSLGLLLPLQAAALTLLPIAYHTLFIGERGATPGMQLMDIEARSLDGRKPDYLQAFVRLATYSVSVGITGLLVLAVVFFNDKRRALHDFLSGTVVVRSRAAESRGELPS